MYLRLECRSASVLQADVIWPQFCEQTCPQLSDQSIGTQQSITLTVGADQPERAQRVGFVTEGHAPLPVVRLQMNMVVC